MRTLSATLEAAQKKPDRLPYVEAKVYDFEQGITRLTWERVYESGPEADDHHGIAFDGHGDMHRIRADAGSKLYYQKVSSPGSGSDYSTWTLIATDCYGPCAIAAYGAKVYIFYRTTGNVLWKYYSHDYGATWNDAQLVNYASVLSLAACWWGTGDIVVCFAAKSTEVNGIVLDSSTQATSQHTDTFNPPHTLIYTRGIGATYDAANDLCQVVFAAKENGAPSYHHYDLFRTEFSNAYAWLAIESFISNPDGELMTHEYPDCHLPASPQSYETTRITAVEKYGMGAMAYNQHVACHLVKGEAWASTTFTDLRPLTPHDSLYGLRMASTPTHWWLEKPNDVWRAPRVAEAALDLSPRIISLTANCQLLAGGLIIELDNHDGYFASPGTGALVSLRFRSEVVLKLGYKTTAGDESSEAGTYWIDAWEYRSAYPNMSTFVLTCIDGSGLADKWTARYQMRWNQGVASKTVWQILHQILARFGIRLTNVPAKPQSSAITTFYPDFTIESGTGGDAAIRRLLSFVEDKLVFRGQEAFTKNPLATESSCYIYGANHIILAGEYTDNVSTSWARAIGRSATGARLVNRALDWDALALAIDILKQDYDPNLTTLADVQERADAILRTESLRARRGQVTVPTNCGQELLDVVTLTDVRVGLAAERYRVEAIETDYNRRDGHYEQKLFLSAP